MSTGNVLVVVVLVAIALAGTFGAGVWLGSVLADKYRHTAGHREGYDAGYNAMLKVHEDYRAHNRAILKMIQSLTPDDPGTLAAGAQPPGTFDTSGAFDVHRVTERGAQAVGRAPTLALALETAHKTLTGALERGAPIDELVITKPGPDGPRVAVACVHLGADGELLERRRMVPPERYAPPPPAVG